MASVTQGCNHGEPPTTGDLFLDIYKAHLDQRQILITGEITEAAVELVALQIMRFNEEDDERECEFVGYDRMDHPITLKIASNGGLVSSCLAIVSQIEHSLTPVISVAIGDCSSAAAIILLSAHLRFSSVYSRIMIHSLAAGMGGKMQGILDYAEHCAEVQKTIDEIVTTRTAITQEQLDEVRKTHKDWYLTAEQAVELGVIDEVIPVGLGIPPYKERIAEEKREAAEREKAEQAAKKKVKAGGTGKATAKAAPAKKEPAAKKK